MESFQNQQEKDFYKDQIITVSNSRYIAGGKTYAMRNISSVSIFEVKKSWLTQVLLIIAGIIFLLSKANSLGIVLIGIGLPWLLLAKTKYSVRITTNSGEVNSFISTDKYYVLTIVSALNEAIVHRG